MSGGRGMDGKQNPPRYWEKIVQTAHDLGEVAKLIALVLAIITFAGFYRPDWRRKWEIFSGPQYWYRIGTINHNGIFSPVAYSSSLWAGRVPERNVAKLPGTIILTDNDELHPGRMTAGGLVGANQGKGACLYVHQVKARRELPKPTRYVWARATKITC